jgi:hypothetical protein
MSLFEWCQWLQHTRFATAISESDWLYPLIEGSHILALPLSVDAVSRDGQRFVLPVNVPADKTAQSSGAQ